MCLILFAKNAHPDYPLVLAANRDEFFNRNALPAHFWNEVPELLAGKDLSAAGTWLGLHQNGKFSALTNYRDFSNIKQNAPTRGFLALDFLIGQLNAPDYITQVNQRASLYNGFNLLLGQLPDLYYYSNIDRKYEPVPNGVHGLSNALLNTPWPKVEKGKMELGALVANGTDLTAAALFELLSDKEQFADNLLPSTGIGLEKERLLSSKYIRFGGYGTRCSTAILVKRNGEVLFSEKTYSEDEKKVHIEEFNFSIKLLG